MQHNIRSFVFILTIIAVMLMNAVSPYSVHADDGVTPETPAAEVDPVGDETSPPESSDAEVVPVEEQTPSLEESVLLTGELMPTEAPVAPAEEQPIVEESISVAEVLEQAPEGTELLVINEDGEIESLATEAAAEIVAAADPMWCPAGTTPGTGSVGCTGSFGDFASLITALEADAIATVHQYTGPGVIWVEDSYNGNDNAQITFDGTTLTNLNNSSLTIQGGWSGGNNTSITGTSLADVSMVFVNWTGNIVINDFDIAAADGAGFGLFINNTGTISLDNVSVNNTTANAYGFGDGAVLNNTGNVVITDSEFNNNTGNGLQVESTGTIGLDTVSANDNLLTGANLDSCLYGSATPSLCAGNGAVTIVSTTSNLFSNNGFNGLVVDAGGGITIDNTQANANDLNGTILTSADANGTGNVTIAQSTFAGNANGTGLDILTDGSINVTDVDTLSNGTGAVLDTTNGVGAINVNGSNFGVDSTNGNTWTGLHAESGSTISLVDVIASYNGTNGAYLEAEGNITVTDSTFNENVHFNYPEDPGLYANSNGGNITLTNVIADGNDYGAGAVLTTGNNGAIDVAGGHYNGNGTFGIQAQSQNGDITLDSVTASYNKVKGAYLASYGLGNIFVRNNSIFIENGSYGIYAKTDQGSIDLDLVTVTGDNGVDDGAVGADNLTDYGAVLITGNNSNVFVSDSTFNLNTETGLLIAAGGQVDLVNVTAGQNGGNGVEVYSTYTQGCRCPDTQIVNIAVNIDGGTFTNNGDYGLMVRPGPEGTLVFVNPSTFGGNGLGDYLLDLSSPPECEDCDCDDTPSDTNEPNIVEVPFTGGIPVEQDCEQFSSTILELPNGTWVNVGCPFEGYSNLEGVLEETLPGQLGAGTDFTAGITISLTDDEGNTILHEDGTLTINFSIPEDSRGRSYSVLFWDPTLNDGMGGWVQMPLYEAGTSFPLHPDDPEDGRIIISGVKKIGNTITLTVNFPGVFVLVTP